MISDRETNLVIKKYKLILYYNFGILSGRGYTISEEIIYISAPNIGEIKKLFFNLYGISIDEYGTREIKIILDNQNKNNIICIWLREEEYKLLIRDRKIKTILD